MPAYPIRIGVSITPQHGDIATMRQRWRDVEALGCDSLWTWDHFFPLNGDPDGLHYECFSLLAAMAVETNRVTIGPLVACNSYRNPHLLADMARTIDQLSGGRFILGVGSGWNERDYTEYGYDYKSAKERLQDLRANMPVIGERLATLNPGPVSGKIPVMIGGNGEQVTMRIAARHADLWNGNGDPAEIARLNGVLDERCREIGRDPGEIERSINLRPGQEPLVDAYVESGMTHFIVEPSGPAWDLSHAEALVRWRDRRG
ncbi:MAG: LLM class F420-dependent oxidoreductase [Chloroflexota bacterium]